eukprot:3014847-Pyramimonas_sp.AAC.1
MSMTSRTWSLAREDVTRAWTRDAQPDWGAAVAGNSALREAFLRALRDGGLSRMGISFGATFSDIKGFYDAMQWGPLVRTALKLGFPPVVLGL